MLHEEQGGAELPGLAQTGAQGQPARGHLKTVLLYQGSETGVSTEAEVLVQGRVESGKATAEEQTAVVSAAGQHGGIVFGQVPPAGTMGKFPEDGIQ